MMSTLYKAIAEADEFTKTRDRILSDWNFYPKQKRQAIYDRHYRLMVGMMDKYRLSTCQRCHRAIKTESSIEYCECGAFL
jgi:hypothetical protein